MSDPVLAMGEYLAGALWLGFVVGAFGFAGVRLRRVLLPAWDGMPARIAEATAAITLAVAAAEIAGTLSAFTEVGYPIAALATVALTAVLGSRLAGRARSDSAPPAPAGPPYGYLVVAIVAAAVFAGWAIPTLTGIASGMTRADSLWYHMPLSLRFADTGSTGDLFFFDPIFFAHFYPATSELIHAIPILAFGRDFLSPVLNLGFLALGLAAAAAIGRPWGLGPHAFCGAAIVLGAETMTNFQAGEALNDIVGVSFLLCAVAILVNGAKASDTPIARAALALAGAAAGLAVGTKLSFLAPVALLTLAVLWLAPRAHRVAGLVAFAGPMLAAGGYWYARNLVQTGNPIPFSSFGPLGLPMPERDFELRPGFAVVHYWNDTGVWSDWFFPKLSEELGPLWPLILGALAAGMVYAIWRSREPLVRALGAVALLTAVAYLFTPLTAGGEEGEPIAFEWNVRYLVPALAVGLALIPVLAPLRLTERRRKATLAVLAGVALVTTLTIVQWPDGGHTKGAIATGALVLVLFGGVWLLRSRGLVGPGAKRGSVAVLVAGVLMVSLVAGFLLQRHYLERRYNDLSPQLNIAGAVSWANQARNERIAVSGVRGVFNQYAFTGPDLSNHVQWLGIRGKDDAFLRIPDCETWREKLNEGDYTYAVTLYDPFLPDGLTDTKEGLWTRADPATTEILRDGPVSVFSIDDELDPAACGDLPDLTPAELNGDSVNSDPRANQPPPGSAP